MAFLLPTLVLLAPRDDPLRAYEEAQLLKWKIMATHRLFFVREGEEGFIFGPPDGDRFCAISANGFKQRSDLFNNKRTP